MADATKATACLIDHMTYTQAPEVCKKNIFHLLHFTQPAKNYSCIVCSCSRKSILISKYVNLLVLNGFVNPSISSCITILFYLFIYLFIFNINIDVARLDWPRLPAGSRCCYYQVFLT